MRIAVYTDAGQLVDEHLVDNDASDYAIARRLIGANVAVMGWLGRVLRDGRELEAGRDPERPSEKAMRLAASIMRQDEHECPGHPCEDDTKRFPHASIGDVYYCDGSCRPSAA